jgi:hypothetical protein
MGEMESRGNLLENEYRSGYLKSRVELGQSEQGKNGPGVTTTQLQRLNPSRAPVSALDT